MPFWLMATQDPLFRSLSKDRESQMERQPHLTTVTITYIAKISERIRRVCEDYNIRTAFKTAGTLRTTLVRVKDPRTGNYPAV